MGLPILLATFLHTILASSSNTFAAPFPDPELIVQEVNEKVNASRRNLGYFSCGTGNPIDDCWRCDPNWEKNRPHLANCGIGFGRNAIGGRDGKIYVVNDTRDDAVNPKPGTLRYGVIQTELLWIIFSRDMTIKLKQKLIMNSFKTIDGRGSSVHIAGGPCITIKSATNIIIHNINIHDCEQGNHSYIRHSPTLVVYHRESDGDGITVYDSSQIWVDHCSLSNCQDGLIDVTHGSTSVTISNNYFTNHDKVMLLSHSDKYVRDKDMQVTVAYNHFGEGLVERMPRCRHGFFHVVNNDYTRWRMYAIGGSASPTINSEGNRFIAPDNSSSKQVTRREDTLDDAQWRTWNWRTQGDILQNGSYFIPSGSIADADYARASSLGAKPSSMIEMITKGAGSLSCEIGKPC